MSGQAQVGLNALMIEALRAGVAIHIWPASGQYAGEIVVEAHCVQERATAKTRVSDVDAIPAALSRMISEVLPQVKTQTADEVGGCEDLV